MVKFGAAAYPAHREAVDLVIELEAVAGELDPDKAEDAAVVVRVSSTIASTDDPALDLGLGALGVPVANICAPRETISVAAVSPCTIVPSGIVIVWSEST
jgi:hypothetical protein